MQLPGIIEITPDQSDLLAKGARILGTSFLEELWFATWLSALDSLGADRARKEAIMHAYFQTELELHAPYHALLRPMTWRRSQEATLQANSLTRLATKRSKSRLSRTSCPHC